MERQRKITISFSDEFLDVYQFLKKQSNMSNYACRALRLIIDGDDLETRVKHIVSKLLSERGDTTGNHLDELVQAVDCFEF